MQRIPLLLFLICLGGWVDATIPDCSVLSVNISYVKEDCFNATHRVVQTGKCINGNLREETTTIVGCKDYSPVPAAAQLSSSKHEYFCHRCQDHRVVCSELEYSSQACSAHLSDDTFCRQVQSIASFSGCLDERRYYTAVEYCSVGRVPDAAITPKVCANENGPEFYRCMSCHDGLHVCAETDAMMCEEIGLPAPSSNATAGQGAGDTSLNDSEEYGNFDCNQFWGDVQFYGESCFNQTHRVVTTGLCVEGQVQGLSFQTSPCSDDADDKPIQYCHECQGKAVCADTPIKFNVCDESDKVRSCSPFTDQTAHFAACDDEFKFFLRSESCREGSGMLSQRTSQCGEHFPGLPYCIDHESSNFQLCSSVPQLPAPPVACDSTDLDVVWNKMECFNATHTLYRSGRCIDGHTRSPVAKVEPCGGYCHQCTNSTVVCSLSNNPGIACLPATDENEKCENTGLVSFAEECADPSTFKRTVQTCLNGKIDTDRSVQDCASKYYKTPRCLACDSAAFCVAEEGATCETFGSVPLSIKPTPGNGARDGIVCPAANVSMNYYQESCYNSTHVRLVQGDCANGSKLDSQSALISCVEYGVDEGRRFCHECATSVTCSNVAQKVFACERASRDFTCDDSISDLTGMFGCLNDEIFFTDFATCKGGVHASEINGFRCADVFPAYKYCNTCGSVNLCTDRKWSCKDLGF